MRNIHMYPRRSQKTFQALLLLYSTSYFSLQAAGTSTFTSESAAFHTSHRSSPHSCRRGGGSGCRSRYISSFSSVSWPLSSSSSLKFSSVPPHNLDSVDYLAEQLSQRKFKNIVVVVGAGASVNAGIPDFRTPGTGLYDQLQEYSLPRPEAIFDLNFFKMNPKPFLRLARSIWPGRNKDSPKPTVTHSFLRVLQEEQILRRIYTQNIDGLESISGIDDDKLVECHGHFRSASCISCGKSMDANRYQEIIFRTTKTSRSIDDNGDDDEDDNSNNIPTCTGCRSFVKPDIVFFGEALPMRFQSLILEDVERCDLLVVIGSSLLVDPVASIPKWISVDCPRVLLNLEVVGDFNNKSRKKADIILQGDCDESVRRLCQLVGWESKINQLYQKTTNGDN